jgi:hypothetical protein
MLDIYVVRAHAAFADEFSRLPSPSLRARDRCHRCRTSTCVAAAVAAPSFLCGQSRVGVGGGGGNFLRPTRARAA